MIRRSVVFLAILGWAGAAAAQTKAIVAPAGGDGIQRGLLPVVTGALREAVATRGYSVLDAEATEPVILVAGTPPVPNVDELRRLAGSANALVAAHVELTKAGAGRVKVRVHSATREAPGNWEALEDVPAGDVIPAVRRLVDRAVPPAPSATPAAPPPIVSPTPGPPIVSPGPTEPPIVSATPEAPPVVSPTPPATQGEPPIMENTPASDQELVEDVEPAPVSRPLRYHLWLGPMTEGAIGTNRGYYNQMVGARAVYLLTRQFGIDAVASYAYLSDDPGFALVFWGGLQARIGLSSTRRTSVPVRFAVGYAPVNGPLVKVEGGLLFPLSPKTDLVLTLLSPTIWFLEGGNAVSMNVGLELGFAAG